jgi:hypothetical protein
MLSTTLLLRNCLPTLPDKALSFVLLMRDGIHNASKGIRTNACALALMSAFILLPALASASSTDADWGYSIFGRVGVSDLIVAQNGLLPEVYANGSWQYYWFVLRYSVASKSYSQVYVSHYYSSAIIGIKVADFFRDATSEIVVATQDGKIEIYDQVTRILKSTMATNHSSVVDLDVADVDADGANEIVLCTYNHLYVHSTNGELKWELAAGGYALAVAQMDSDDALEIATTDGHVVDGVTHAIQWNWPYGFGRKLAAADIDADGKSELIGAEFWDLLWAYDVDRQLPKWSIDAGSDIDVVLAADIDGDGHPEVLVGKGQTGGVVAYDAVSLEKKWTIPNPESGVSNIAIGDVDNDGSDELLWGNSSGPNYFYIQNWQTGQIKWQSPDLGGPFVGPETGDLDGNGRDEMVVVSSDSDSGYGSGRILVFDAVDRRLRAISGPVMGDWSWVYVFDLRLRDVNGDGKQEILVAADWLYDGAIDIYSFDETNTFTLRWRNTTRPDGDAFHSVDAADIDADQQMEIVGGSGNHLYVYSYAANPGALEWQSPDLGGTPVALAISDIDQDGTQEIIAMVDDGNVFVFNGVSKELEATITGPFTVMSVQNVSGILSIILGKSTGDLLMYRYSSGIYVEVYNRKLINSSIDGLTLDSRERVWVSTRGISPNPGILREMLLDGSTLATYSGYGQTFGLRVAMSPSHRYFYTASSYLVAGFRVGSASAGSLDMDGDGKSDVTVWRPSSGVWYSRLSNISGAYSSAQWGLETDTPVPGDYDGDLKMDLAVWRRGESAWYILSSLSPGSYMRIPWGIATDRPAPGDYDGDGKTDVAVWRPEQGIWYILSSQSPGSYTSTRWGISTDIPVPADYDGDSTFDIAVWRPDNSIWYILPSNSPGTYVCIQWGLSTDVPVPGDYDGDGKSDIAVWRPDDSVWYILSSAAPGSYTSTRWGLSTDTPVSGDYDGDSRNDIGVWRAESSVWYILPSANPASFVSVQWGSSTDVPISSLTLITAQSGD